MPLPTLHETVSKFLFADIEEIEAAGLPKNIVGRVIRLRDVYNYWIRHPSLGDKEIVAYVKTMGVEKDMAYADLKVVRGLIGTIERYSKDFIRWKVTNELMAAADRAKAKGNLEAQIKALDKLAKYHNLDKPDDDERYIDLVPQAFEFTEDPTVAGFRVLPDWRKKVKAMKEQYWSEDVQDVEFEQIEFNEEKLFDPKNYTNRDENIPQ